MVDLSTFLSHIIYEEFCSLGTPILFLTNSSDFFVVVYSPQGPQWSSFDNLILLLNLTLHVSILHLPKRVGPEGRNVNIFLITDRNIILI